MANSKRTKSENVVNATTENANETILLNDQKQSEMNDQTTIAENAILEENVANDTNVSNGKENASDDAKNSDIVERDPATIIAEIKNAKRELFRLNELHDYDSANEEITKQEKIVSDLNAELKDLQKTIEKNKLRDEYNAKYKIAFEDVKEKLSLTDDVLNSLIANAKDDAKKDTLKQSFELLFGRVPTFIAENVKGTTLTKSRENANGTINLSKMIKDMIIAGNDQETIVNAIQENSDLDLTKSKKRYTDTKWQYEQSLKK
jgi:hypothetical protein